MNHGEGGFNPLANPAMGWSYLVFQILGNTAATSPGRPRSLACSRPRRRDGTQVYSRTSFFFVCRWLIPVLWGVSALAVLGPAKEGEATLMAMPQFLATFLPVGLMA